jgi:hypothetical protein
VHARSALTPPKRDAGRNAEAKLAEGNHLFAQQDFQWAKDAYQAGLDFLVVLDALDFAGTDEVKSTGLAQTLGQFLRL